LINYTSYKTADFRWLRYIAIVITLGDWFQTEYSLYTEHGKNRIESKSGFFVQNRIEIDRLAKISYRHSTTVKCSCSSFPPLTTLYAVKRCILAAS